MTFSVSKHGNTVTIGIEGHLVVGNRQALKQLVLDELASGERNFRVDFARTRYVDSSGLGVLVAMSKKVAQGSGTFSLANLDEDLRTLFVLTKLDTLFTFDDGPVPTPMLPPTPRAKGGKSPVGPDVTKGDAAARP